MNRIEQFYQLPYFEALNSLPEKLIEKEQELDESLGDNFTFSKKEYDVDGKRIILGRINSWYFLGGAGTEFKVFEDKKLILIHIKKEFEKANEDTKQSGDELDPSWKGFWGREIESL